MEIKDVINKLLCYACLSVDRNIIEITNENVKKYYNDVLDEVPLNKCKSFNNLMVCWECEAILKKCLKFREQMKDSYRILQTYTEENFHECLKHSESIPPSLRVHRNKPISIPINEESETTLAYVKVEDKQWDSIKDENLQLKEEINISDDSCNELDTELNNIISCIDDESSTNCVNHQNRIKTIEQLNNKQNGDYKDDLSNTQPEQYKHSIKISTFNSSDDWEHNKVEITIPACDNITNEENTNTNNSNNTRKSKKIHKKLNNVNQKFTKLSTVELTYEEMLLDRERESKSETYNSARYKCESCIIGFAQYNIYQKHINSKHSPSIGDYTCPICECVTSSVDTFTLHYKRHMTRYCCPVCDIRTTDVNTMYKHYKMTHKQTNKLYKCNVCQHISTSIDTHRYHKDSHKARVQCPDCDKTFSHRAGLMNHRLAFHELQNTFPCKLCDKVFRWKNSLKRHLEKHQNKATNSSSTPQCTICHINFASVSSYQRHMKNSLKHVTQDQLRYICDECGRRFSDKTKLRDHIEEIHLRTTYRCQICDKSYKNRVGVDQHIRNVHRGRPKNKMCHHCGRGFPTNMQLESHMRTHTGERPYICEYCPTTFSQQSNLYKHYRQVHLNMKSKRYPICKRNKQEQVCKVSRDLETEHWQGTVPLSHEYTVTS